MKNILVFLAFLLVIMSSIGCSNEENKISDVSVLREVAWNSLTESAKEEVKGDWRSANVAEVELSELPTVQNGGQPPQVDNLYKVTFKTTSDLILGPIQVFLNADTKEIISYGVRR
ncbi:hypothetical protein [Paenibacillus sp. PDC88]|uniref:Uncharacterized protein n=1 Tax=Paenibacillus provencensis TaxID=441151 RepID=A0ABW3Q286_9BACL|nr:hypothetical protein [Paenibacillus sp. PDC88]SDX88829.1 hypothetical protein SAMN05518848_12330 [Paenibacillus sp. PDC88]